MNKFDELKHPRDSDGKFTTKDYQSMSVEELKQLVTKYPDKSDKENFNKYNPQIQSKVFERISTVKRTLNKKGYAVFTIIHNGKTLRVKLYGGDKDYDYEIMEKKLNGKK